MPYNAINTAKYRVQIRVRGFYVDIFVYHHKLSNRDIARSFNSSTILTYGFIAEKSLCPVHFIITSLGIPSCKAGTTNVRRPQWVVSNAHLGNTSSCRTFPWKYTILIGSSMPHTCPKIFKCAFIFVLAITGRAKSPRNVLSLYLSRMDCECLFNSMRKPSTVFCVTTSMNPSLTSVFLNLATSEYRNPVKQQNKKTSRTCSSAFCVGKNW